MELDVLTAWHSAAEQLTADVGQLDRVAEVRTARIAQLHQDTRIDADSRPPAGLACRVRRIGPS